MDLMLSKEDFLKVWRSCKGGTDAAFDIMFHLSQTQGTTLQELWAIASSVGFTDISSAIENECRRDPQATKKTLEGTSLRLLQEIAEMMSEAPHLPRAPWKTIASAMGVSASTINNLAAHAYRESDQGSLTMQLISFMSMKFPLAKVALMAKAIEEIGREDVLKEEIFANCRRDGCIML